MKGTTIHYKCSKDKIGVLNLFKSYVKDIYLEEEHPETTAEDITHLLIIEPLEINNTSYAVSRVWKRRLMKEGHQHIKLMIAGYCSSNHSNFLNLLDLPKDFNAWLENVKPIADFPFEYAGTEKDSSGKKKDVFVDSWDIYLPKRGVDMLKIMKQFLDGHDKHNSLTNQLTRLATAIRNYNLTENEEDKENYLKNAKQEWNNLFIRWSYYEPLLEELPLMDTRERMKHIIEKILQPSFKSKQIKSSTITEKIQELQGIIRDDIELYVNMEYHW